MLESTRAVVLPIFQEVRNAWGAMFQWIVQVIQALVQPLGKLHSLLPLFMVGLAVVLIFFAVRLIRKIVWGD